MAAKRTELTVAVSWQMTPYNGST